jgi:hypothetical protein
MKSGSDSIAFSSFYEANHGGVISWKNPADLPVGPGGDI